jgi:hypothetical protein
VFLRFYSLAHGNFIHRQTQDFFRGVAVAEICRVEKFLEKYFAISREDDKTSAVQFLLDVFLNKFRLGASFLTAKFAESSLVCEIVSE